MRVLKGIGASHGSAIGVAFIRMHSHVTVPHLMMAGTEGQVRTLADREAGRFTAAVEAAVADVQALAGRTGSEVHAHILEAYLLMLQDPELQQSILKVITDRHINAEWAVEQVCSSYVAALEASSGDSSLRERAVDIKDVGARIIRKLTHEQTSEDPPAGEDVILVCDNLLPSEFMDMDRSHIKGVVLAGGSRTSHVAILFRSYDIPAVVAVKGVLEVIVAGQELFIDGTRGEVVTDMDAQERDRLEKHSAGLLRTWEQDIKELAFHKAVTTDGKLIPLKANIELVDELAVISQLGSDGIGLYRTEFLFMHSHALPSEDEQFATYRRMVESMRTHGPVTIRTLDMGGDKIIPALDSGESNPVLGWRAIRFSLSEPQIFLTQLRAILRASAYGPVRIMFPMVSGIEELDMALELLEQARQDLRHRKIAFDGEMEVGTMIEVPSAALCSDLLASRVDFFSIGTNDLIQYTVAVDRSNSRIAHLYQPFHPGVLRLLRMIVDNAHEAGITVSACGEMAGDVAGAALLVGMGVDELSMTPQSLLAVRKTISAVSFAAVQEMAEHVLTLQSAAESERYIRKMIHE